jgi:leucyl-tRNA synthetase
MPSWAGSSWYYLRYEDNQNGKALVDKKKEKYWSPVDLYVGGAEHATRHLIYARFWHKFLYDIGVVGNIEPFTKLQPVGLIMGQDGRKMSKRFGNVVNPDDIVKSFGADTLRVYEMFMGPFDQQISWSTNNMAGSRRFIERVWNLRAKVAIDEDAEANLGLRDYEDGAGTDTPATHGGRRATLSRATIEKILHQAIKKVTDDINNLRFNTAISSLMIATNNIDEAQWIGRKHFEIILKLLAPFAPHMTEELWISLGNKKSLHISDWPKYDPELAAENEVTIIVQVNGKVRASFKAPTDSSSTELEARAKAVPEVKKWIDGKDLRKVIAVANRLVNLVVAEVTKP